MSGVPILEVVDLHAAYGRIEVLRGVDLVVPKGAVMALLGPNGAGKSTLVKVISGQKKPTSGDIHLGGVHVKASGPEELARLGLCTIPEETGIVDTTLFTAPLRASRSSGWRSNDMRARVRRRGRPAGIPRPRGYADAA